MWLFFSIWGIKRVKEQILNLSFWWEKMTYSFVCIRIRLAYHTQMWLRGGLLTISKTLSNKMIFNLAKKVSSSRSQKFKLNMWQMLSVGKWLTAGKNCQEKQVIFPSHEVVKLELNNSQEIIWLLPRTNYWSQYIVN